MGADGRPPTGCPAHRPPGGAAYRGKLRTKSAKDRPEAEYAARSGELHVAAHSGERTVAAHSGELHSVAAHSGERTVAGCPVTRNTAVAPTFGLDRPAAAAEVARVALFGLTSAGSPADAPRGLRLAASG